METLHFSIEIEASREKVWDTMLEDDSYRKWTEVFAPGSYYEGSWDQGSRILFLGPGEDGSTGGMVARIKESRPYKFISIEHLGVIEDGKEDTSSEKVKKWAGALENYIFTEKGGKTEVRVDMDTEEEHKEMFLEIWPKALKKLKELAEGSG